MVRRSGFTQLIVYLIRVCRFFAPWLWRAFIGTVNWLIACFWIFWGGVPGRVSVIANQWVDRAVVDGFPTIWDRRLYQVLWVIAFVTIFVGWVFLAYITVWLIGAIL